MEGEAAIATTARVAEADGPFDAPYAPSWLNVLIRWIERLPGPAWLFYAALIPISVVLVNSQLWLSGLAPVGEFAVEQTFYGLMTVATLWLIHYLDGVARGALDAFRSALAVSDEELGRQRHELTVVPARPAAVLTVLTALLTIAWYASDPVGSAVAELSPAGLAVRAASEIFVGAVFVLLAYHTLRQLRAVSRIHASAARVDLFQPGPLYAFSQLTSRTAMALVLLATSPLLVTPLNTDQGFTVIVWGGWIVGTMALAVAAFALPLQGMHRRLAAEKRRLQGEVGRRLTATLDALHGAVDGGDTGRIDAHNRALASLIAERDLVNRLSTWPWQAGTVGAFASAILLPIGLWLATRALERLV